MAKGIRKMTSFTNPGVLQQSANVTYNSYNTPTTMNLAFSPQLATQISFQAAIQIKIK